MTITTQDGGNLDGGSLDNGSLDALRSEATGMPLAGAGTPDDPVMREGLRLIEAFFAIEDPTARAALITLAEGLVSHAWVRKAQNRG